MNENSDYNEKNLKYVLKEYSMEKETKHHLIIAVTTVTLFAVLMNLRSVLGVFRELLGLGVPIFAGCILALFIRCLVSPRSFIHRFLLYRVSPVGVHI